MVEAAAHLLWAQGFHGTGLQEILARSRAQKGSMYFHFPGGKEELAGEAMRASGRFVLTGVRGALEHYPDAASGIRAVVDAFATFLRDSSFDLGCPVATVTLEAASKSDVIRTAAQEVYDDWMRVLADRLAADGYPPERCEPLAMLVLSSIQGALILSRARMDVSPLEMLSREIEGMLGRRPRRRRQPKPGGSSKSSKVKRTGSPS
ncbi:MAG TPA: TetR/AcrR family transcriptional regulator [Actinomycetota bacterium]|nr:TetR/AcrR family transcriptional regulator [Actinomycetota bacterium]